MINTPTNKIRGLVVNGSGRGLALGFPTANLKIVDGSVNDLEFGVYAVNVFIEFDTHLFGVANYGSRPTFGDSKPIIEVHIFDFDDDIYSRIVSIEFFEFIRYEQKFANEEALKIQIVKDIEIVRDILDSKIIKHTYTEE